MKKLNIGASTITAALLVISLLTSIGLYATVQRPERVERILFFPGAVERELDGEIRLLPRTEDLEADIELLVEELTYGPAKIDRSRVVPREARPQSVMVRNGTAYVDLSTRMLDDDTSVNLSIEEGLEAIRHTLEYNFRQLDHIVLTVGGELLRGQEQPET